MVLSDEEGASKPDFYHEGEFEEKSGGPSEAADASAAGDADIDDEDIGDVNMDELGNKVWLVKVPMFLADKWKKQQREDGVQLGKMRIYDKPDQSGSNISIILNESDEYKDIPKEYRMQVTNERVNNMFIFSEGRDPNEIIKPTSTQANKAVPLSMTGTVHHECTVTPSYTPEYKRIMRKRVLEQHKNSRRVQVVNQSEFNRSMLSVDANTFDTAQKKPKIDTRTARMERQDLMNTLFAGFEKFPFWTFKGLVEHTKQPSAYLKEVLGDIAKLNKSGPYANMYSLKPEFRKASAEAAAAASAAAEGASQSAAAGVDSMTLGGRDGLADDLDDIDEDDDFEDV
ncbi:hypothetical protein H4R20_001438 [Coemansia guatemalensis]|uniref:Transcription initiation factor IIF subunit beta n=1 Tax=Coemansia guatemalensis TaxID=2761395 RepID=A0A9W8HZ67_9FUNG|nr:hypothetical protein H4R20_001438 [Coemansia guatemalensis]